MASSWQVRINFANEAELREVYGIGEVSAGNILTFRGVNGNLTQTSLREILQGSRVKLTSLMLASFDFTPNPQYSQSTKGLRSKQVFDSGVDYEWDDQNLQESYGQMKVEYTGSGVNAGRPSLKRHVSRLPPTLSPQGLVDTVPVYNMDADPTFMGEGRDQSTPYGLERRLHNLLKQYETPEGRVVRGGQPLCGTSDRKARTPDVSIHTERASRVSGTPNRGIRLTTSPSRQHPGTPAWERGNGPSVIIVPRTGETPARGTPVLTHSLRPAGSASAGGIPAGTPTIRAMAQALKQGKRDGGESNGNVAPNEPKPTKSQSFMEVLETLKREVRQGTPQRVSDTRAKVDATQRSEKLAVTPAQGSLANTSALGIVQALKRELRQGTPKSSNEAALKRSETTPLQGTLANTSGLAEIAQILKREIQSQYETPRKSVTETPARGTLANNSGWSEIVQALKQEMCSPGEKQINETPSRQRSSETPAKGAMAETSGWGEIVNALKQELKEGGTKNTPRQKVISETPVNRRRVQDVLKGMPKSLTFDGKTNWIVFRHKLVRYVEALELTDPEALDCLSISLTGKAADYYAILMESTGNMSYSVLLQKLEERFGVRELVETSRMKFHQLTQNPDDTLDDWSDRVLTQAMLSFRNYKLDPEYVGEECVMRFCQGLTDRGAAEHVSNTRPKTMQEAKNTVQVFQHVHLSIHGKGGRKDVRKGSRETETVDVMAVQGTDGGSGSAKSSVICYGCGKEGHIKLNCPSMPPGGFPKYSGPTRPIQGGSLEQLQAQMAKVAFELRRLANNSKPAQFQNARQQNTVQPQSANAKGGQETRSCFYCGEIGHIKVNCPKRVNQAAPTVSETLNSKGSS
jgi:hypothetical protein